MLDIIFVAMYSQSIALEVRLSLQIALVSLINCIIQECRRRMSLCVGTFCT